ncbi:MAG: hypothetical protein JW854_07360 [Actinobacteria bacterium]|nr:hypothetical protein [Actinomycetota bacterium]
MGELKLCKSCGVPVDIGKVYMWQAGGVIMERKDPERRAVIHDTEAFNKVCEDIEALIGVPIENMIIESRCRMNRRQQEALYPPWRRKIMKACLETFMGPGLMGKTLGRPIEGMAQRLTMEVNDIGRSLGLGDVSLGDLWGKGEKYPHRENIIRNPYSLSCYCGDALGATEGWEDREMWVRYDETGDNTFRVTTYEGEHPIELQGRLQARFYAFKDGDIRHEPCPLCGVPASAARFVWNAGEGTVTDPDTGRRVIITDPLTLQAVFDDLEAELGEDIPRAIIASQRESMKSAGLKDNLGADGSVLKQMLATRGLGNLVRFETGGDGLQVTIENSCLHLLMVGMMQAAYEHLWEVEGSTYSWKLAEDGDLEVSIT